MRIDWIKRVLVVGAGTMGHSIAMLFAQDGFEVDVVDLAKPFYSSRLKGSFTKDVDGFGEKGTPGREISKRVL